jgi:LysM repeat protein
LCFIIFSIFTIKTFASTEQSIVIAKFGSHGKIVFQIQKYLYQLEYIKSKNIDGAYGKITTEAVKSFQLEHILPVTGIVDNKTWQQLNLAIRDEFFDYTVIEGDSLFSIAQKYNLSMPALMVYNKLNENSVIYMGEVLKIPQNILYLNRFVSRGRIVNIPAIPWSIVNKLWKVGEVAVITDYETGKSFQVRRLGGWEHTDVTLLTKNDSIILYSLNKTWTWARRGVIVTIHRQKIAASINCYPHKKQQMICVHFASSRIHQNNSIDKIHQEKINEVEMDEKGE